MKILKVFFVFSTTLSMGFLQGVEDPIPLISVGSGYLDAGENHSEGVFQIEYKFAKYFLGKLRPQASLIFPELRSLFFGLGLGADFFLSKRLIVTPSFSPGIYYQGSGKDLGYPLEFRLCLEAFFECENHSRLGCQFYHISNASLSSKNPGINAFVFIVCIPLKRKQSCPG